MAGGLIAASGPFGVEGEPSSTFEKGRFRIWDAHSHLEALHANTEERMRFLVRHMDKLGIERLLLSQGFGDFIYHATPEQVRTENDRVMEAVRLFPDHAYGSLYLNPENVEFCLQELDRKSVV